MDVVVVEPEVPNAVLNQAPAAAQQVGLVSLKDLDIQGSTRTKCIQRPVLGAKKQELRKAFSKIMHLPWENPHTKFLQKQQQQQQ